MTYFHGVDRYLLQYSAGYNIFLELIDTFYNTQLITTCFHGVDTFYNTQLITTYFHEVDRYLLQYSADYDIFSRS